MGNSNSISGTEVKTHTILGAGGSIGNSLADELLRQNQVVKLVSRSGFSMPGADTVKGDLLSFPDTVKAVKGADVVYLCAGLPYRYEVWKEQWPKIMDHVIEACIKENALLIFFDNVYMYGRVEGKMTEQTPYDPCSKKGEVRARISLMLEEEMMKRNIRAIIARAADLYGPYSVQSSVLYMMMIANLKKGKKAQWMGSMKQPHSFTYTLDCAKGLKLLADDPKARNQVWHLPTSNPGLTAEEWVRLIADAYQSDPKYTLLKNWMVSLAGLLNKTIGEVYEMIYQQEMNYHFDSTKFNTYFKFTPTSYEQGLGETIRFLEKIGN
ncbi:NAD-dependent epimerase/dehydratase family protein [Mangrovibacterium lignilyticum]|uniref:NAD-dependent epimerase/dehydratase family protein n=1 Tax=Mangrovibacterium lignilyticum TaxID=2668052 RepID=UPI0013D42B3D|nr:NAD-dependent epimerase/dehydratase family protein [Mangrovibacterium lignilyticum]